MHDDYSCDMLYEHIRRNVEHGLAKRDEILGRVRRGKPSRETWMLVARNSTTVLENISHALEQSQVSQSLRAPLEMDSEGEQ